MKLLASLVGVLLILLGTAGVIWPGAIITVGYHLVTPFGLCVAAAFRIGIGLVLILAARDSRLPKTLRVLGLFIFVAGLLTPFVGADRARSILDWSVAQGPAMIRLPALAGILVGAFVAYAVSPRHRPA